MLRYFKYELKERLKELIIITAIFTVLVFVINTNSMKGYIENGYYRQSYADMFIMIFFLIIMCYSAPGMEFAFKTKRRVVDQLYSLPITRKKIFAVKAIVGLILVLVPFTVAYWTGLIQNKLTLYASVYGENCDYSFVDRALNMRMGFFFELIVWATVLYVINTFFYTRANSNADGAMFMLIPTFALVLPYFLFGEIYFMKISQNASEFANFNPAFYSSLSPLISEFNRFEANVNALVLSPIKGQAFVKQGIDVQSAISMCIMLLTAVACGFGLIYTADKLPAEGAGGISDSWFGYKVFIPYTTYFFLASILLIFDGAIDAGGIIALIATFAWIFCICCYFFYRRKLQLEKKYWFISFITVAAALLTALIF